MQDLDYIVCGTSSSEAQC